MRRREGGDGRVGTPWKGCRKGVQGKLVIAGGSQLGGT